MSPDKIGSYISRMNSLITIATGSLLFVLVVIVLNMIVKMLFGTVMASGLRARATIELTGAMLSEIVVLVLLLFYLTQAQVQVSR